MKVLSLVVGLSGYRAARDHQPLAQASAVRLILQHAVHPCKDEVDTGFTPVESKESTDMNIRITLRLRDDFMRTCGRLARTRVKTLVLKR